MKETICGAACARLPLLAYLEFKNQIEYYNFVSLLFSLNKLNLETIKINDTDIAEMIQLMQMLIDLFLEYI